MFVFHMSYFIFDFSLFIFSFPYIYIQVVILFHQIVYFQNGLVSCCQAMISLPDSHMLVNGKDYSGKTPIHLAAAAGSYQVLVELTKVDFANIKATDNENR